MKNTRKAAWPFLLLFVLLAAGIPLVEKQLSRMAREQETLKQYVGPEETPSPKHLAGETYP